MPDLNQNLFLKAPHRVYPDQTHFLPHVRQHQYLAMEDFFDGSFESKTSTSRNEDMYFDMDTILYGSRADSSAAENSRQQKARIPDKDKHKAQVANKKKLKQELENEDEKPEKFVISDEVFDDY